MQVFMPYPDLKTSVCCLDSKRLGNQIYREAKTLISGGWPNHPAAKLWANHKRALASYALHGLDELNARGRYYPKWMDFFLEYFWSEPDTGLPPIIGYEPFHSGHRAALLGKGWQDKVWTATEKDQTIKLILDLPSLRKFWELKHYYKTAKYLSIPLNAETWYSKFGWAETPEPDTKRAYIWRLP
jgi:hypothetical protein